jgi:polysaccharide biosynthesis/export protein
MHATNNLPPKLQNLVTVIKKKRCSIPKGQTSKIKNRVRGYWFFYLRSSSVLQAVAFWTLLFFVGEIIAQTAGPVGATSDKPRTPLNSVQQEYLISPDDLLDLYIVDVPELSRTYRVSPTGQVTLPLLSRPLNVAGLTLNQFADLAAQELKARKLVSDPQITVNVKESRTHSVTITGAVKKPQIYFVLGRTTLLDVISQAEGLAEDASSVANISRGEIAKRMLASGNSAAGVSTVDLDKLLHTGDPDLNIDIYPGDRVTVAPAGVVYVVGAVNKPGGFALTASRKRLTVLQAVALAEDMKSTAVGNNAMIVRRGPQYPGGREEIPVKLKDVLAGKAPDIPLQVEDILFVPDSPGKKAAIRGVEAAIQVATGVAIYRR